MSDAKTSNKRVSGGRQYYQCRAKSCCRDFDDGSLAIAFICVLAVAIPSKRSDHVGSDGDIQLELLHATAISRSRGGFRRLSAWLTIPVATAVSLPACNVSGIFRGR
jgi:hypothetical protein